MHDPSAFVLVWWISAIAAGIALDTNGLTVPSVMYSTIHVAVSRQIPRQTKRPDRDKCPFAVHGIQVEYLLNGGGRKRYKIYKKSITQYLRRGKKKQKIFWFTNSSHSLILCKSSSLSVRKSTTCRTDLLMHIRMSNVSTIGCRKYSFMASACSTLKSTPWNADWYLCTVSEKKAQIYIRNQMAETNKVRRLSLYTLHEMRSHQKLALLYCSR